MSKILTEHRCNKVAVFSDIHSNSFALNACYVDATCKGADCFVFLGDYVSGLADTIGTMDLVYEIRNNYPTVCIRGNRERYMIEHKKGVSVLKGDLFDSTYLYTYEQLREKDHRFFESIPIYDAVIINDTCLELAHATRESDRCYFDGNTSCISEVFSKMTSEYLLTGHSHKQYIQTQGKKTIINPGSVGLPQGNVCLSQYALLDIKSGIVTYEFRKVAYDYKKLIDEQFDSGLVARAKYWAISDLYNAITGIEYTKKLLERVYTYKSAKGYVDDELWCRFATELGMCNSKEEILAMINKIE